MEDRGGHVQRRLSQPPFGAQLRCVWRAFIDELLKPCKGLTPEQVQKSWTLRKFLRLTRHFTEVEVQEILQFIADRRFTPKELPKTQYRWKCVKKYLLRILKQEKFSAKIKNKNGEVSACH